MREFANLVLNESEKIYRKKRIFVVMLILASDPAFVYAQYREIETTQKDSVQPIGRFHCNSKLLILRTG